MAGRGCCGDAPSRSVAAAPLAEGHTRLVFELAYLGGGFHGFAAQPGQRTVAGELADALERIFGERPRIVCAGRTDAGVHARAQVAHADVPSDVLKHRYGAATPGVPIAALARSLSHQLAPDAGVHVVATAPPGFDARHGATWRRYRYDLDCSGRLEPARAATAWSVEGDLDLAAMRLGVDPLIGEHDFAAFCRRVPGEVGPIRRRVLEAALNMPEEGLVRFEIAAVAFCHQMVRSIVGVLVAIGLGRARPPDVVTMLHSGSRSGAPSPAPAKGLTLIGVGYPEALGGDRR